MSEVFLRFQVSPRFLRARTPRDFLRQPLTNLVVSGSRILSLPRKHQVFPAKIDVIGGESSWKLSAWTREGSLPELDDSPVSVELHPICSETQFDRVLAEAQQLEESIIIVCSASTLEEAIGLDKAAQQGSLRGGANTHNVNEGEESAMVTDGGGNNHIDVEQREGDLSLVSREGDLSLVPREGEGLELSLVPHGGEIVESREHAGTVVGDKVVPLVSLPPINVIAGSTSDWILNKDNGFLQTLGLSYGKQGEHEDQFKTLLTAIEASHARDTKSKFKKSRELKNLSWAINYDAKGDSSSRGKAKGRAL